VRFIVFLATALVGLGCGSGTDIVQIGGLGGLGGLGGTGGEPGGGGTAAGSGGTGTGGGSVGATGGTGTGGTGGSAAEPPKSDVISVDDGMFQPGETPPEIGAVNLPAIVSLTGPDAVTNGGSAVLHVQLAQPVDSPQFLVGLVGDSGYHTVVGTDADGDGVYDITVQVAGETELTSLVLRVAFTDGLGNVGPSSEITLPLVASGNGDVKITLSFDRVHDLDLHVVEPNGEEIYYMHSLSDTGGRLDLDSGEHCLPSPSNSENVFWPPGGAPPGDYRVFVVNYEQCSPGEIAFSVTVAHDTLVETFRGSFPDGTASMTITTSNVFEVETFQR
jgi:hypothetical protein